MSGSRVRACIAASVLQRAWPTIRRRVDGTSWPEQRRDGECARTDTLWQCPPPAHRDILRPTQLFGCLRSKADIQQTLAESNLRVRTPTAFKRRWRQEAIASAIPD